MSEVPEIKPISNIQFYDKLGTPIRICRGCDLSGKTHVFLTGGEPCEICQSVEDFTSKVFNDLMERFSDSSEALDRFRSDTIVAYEPTEERIQAIVDRLSQPDNEAPRFTLNEFAMICRKLADSFYRDPATGEPKIMNHGERIMLMVSELAEAFEGARKDKMDDHLPWRRNEEVEMGDALIRELDWSGERKYDLDGAFWEKLLYNMRRADHKPENRAKPGGKKW